MDNGFDKEIRETVEQIGRMELCLLNLQSEVLDQRRILLEVGDLCQEYGCDYYEHLDPQQIDAVILAVTFAASFASLHNANELIRDALDLQKKDE